MQRKQLKNLRKNIDEIWKMLGNRKEKRECLKEGNYQGDL